MTNRELVERNYQKDNNYAPYCLRCSTMDRMDHTKTGWECLRCGAIHDSTTKMDALKTS